MVVVTGSEEVVGLGLEEDWGAGNVIITKHVSNTNTRGVNGFSAICFHKSRAFPDEKKREISAGALIFPRERGFPNKKRGECMDFCVDYDDATGPKRTRKKETEAERDQKEAFITLSPSRVETRCLSSYGPLHST